MSEFVKTVSQLVENQFPSFYKEDGPGFVAFVKAYYEFLETTDKYTYKENRELFNSNDIDNTLNEFLVHFKEKYLADFPFVAATDKRFMIKHIMDYYRSKGSKQSLELLMRLLYNEEVDVYYPGEDVLKPSDSEWYRPVYIEVSKSSRTRGFVNKQIRGSNSGATAFVEGIVTKRIDGKLVDVVYLSSLRGNFIRNERVTDDGIIKNAPKIVGSLTSLTIELGGRNNIVGDIFDVITEQGRQGKVRVDAIENATGRVDFAIVDGGYGYTNTTSSTTATDIYVSTALLYTDNSNTTLDFIRFEPVVQRLETLTLLSATDINSTAVVGDYLVGVSGVDAFVANGYIVSIANTDSEGLPISEASANSTIVVQTIGDTTFRDQRRINLTTNVGFIAGEYIEEESQYTLSISDLSGSFSVGEIVSKTVFEPISNKAISYVFGTVTAANSSSISVDSSWGDWSIDADVIGSTSGATASVVTYVTVVQGARGFITTKETGYIAVREIFGAFTDGEKIRGTRTHLIDTISSTSVTGVADVWLNGVSTANGIIDTSANSYATGIVVGSNTTAVGIYGNTSPFFYANTGVFQIETTREKLVSPPRYANGDIIELNKNILGQATGVSADFDIGFLENPETVTLNTDLVGANNIADIPYIAVALDGSNSSIGFVHSITINAGGTLYSNGTIVTFTGGGFAEGDPLIDAVGFITTNASGTITDITISDPGQGYYAAPTINIGSTSGTVANVSVNINYGYGFPKLPTAGPGTFLIDALSVEDFTIGSIASLTRVNPGANYNDSPFVLVHNKYIASYDRRDFFVYVRDITASFQIGETLTQIIEGTGTAKGKVLSFEVIGDIGTLLIERNAFNISFQTGYAITGDSTGATAFVEGVADDLNRLFANNLVSSVLGDNAIVTGTVIAANGIATSVEVIDSGYGYIPDGDVTLEREGFDFIITAKSNITRQGVGEGYWKTTSSHLNSEKKIHDNSYYQEYSYDVISGLSLNRYENILKRVLHVAGNEMFGSVSKNSKIDSSLGIANSVIEIA